MSNVASGPAEESVFSDVTMQEPPAQDPALAANLTARSGFPHKKAIRAWEQRLKLVEKLGADNSSTFKEALARYGCKDDIPETAVIPDPNSKPGAGTVYIDPKFFSDVNLIVSFLVYRNADTSVSPAKGPTSKPLAQATEKLSDVAAREMHYLEQKQLCVIEAIFRNHGYMRQCWDHYEWLPKWEWVEGELYYDPDCAGDHRRARWAIETIEIPLDTLLADKSIPQETRDKLKGQRDLHEAPGDSTGSAEAKKTKQNDFANEPGMSKVQCYRVWCLDGLLPGYDPDEQTDEDSEGEDSAALKGSRGSAGVAIKDVGGRNTRDGYVPEGFGYPGGDDGEEGPDIHSILRPPPEISDDAPPDAVPFDPREGNRRICALFARNFGKVLKVTPWPMDQYGRNELPYVGARLTNPPGSLHGVPLYQAIKKLLDLRRDIFAIWANDEKHGCRRIIEVQADMTDDKVSAALEKAQAWNVVKVDQVGQIKVTECSPKSQTYKDMIPAIDRDHDTATGINDISRGQAGTVAKTATEATELADNARASFGYLEAEIERFEHNEVVLRVAALQRYVPKESVYSDGCAACAPKDPLDPSKPILGPNGRVPRGPGTITQAPDAQADPFAPPAMPVEVPCEACGGVPAGVQVDPKTGQPVPTPPQNGNGWDAETFAEKRPIKKGADWWLAPEDAAAWRDDLTIEEIRSEVVVTVDQGSGRRDYRERKTAMLERVEAGTVPFLQALPPALGLMKWRELRLAIVEASGTKNPERFIPSEDDIKNAIDVQMQQQQAAAVAANAPKQIAPPPQEQVQAEQAKAEEESRFKRADLMLRAKDVGNRAAIEHRKIDAAQETARNAAMPNQAVAATAQQAMGALAQGVQATLGPLAQVVQGLAAAVATIQQNAAASTQATTELVALMGRLEAANAQHGANMAGAMQGVAAAMAAPKTIIHGPDGRVAGAVIGDPRAATTGG